eukprot:325880-Chlamydomonas_euryale.AAC.1
MHTEKHPINACPSPDPPIHPSPTIALPSTFALPPHISTDTRLLFPPQVSLPQASLPTFPLLKFPLNKHPLPKFHLPKVPLLKHPLHPSQQPSPPSPAATFSLHPLPPSHSTRCHLLTPPACRAIVTAQKALLFEPEHAVCRKFLEVVLQHMQARLAGRAPPVDKSSFATASHSEYMQHYYQKGDRAHSTPFELEVIEAALMVATGQLEHEMAAVFRRVKDLLSKLPR